VVSGATVSATVVDSATVDVVDSATDDDVLVSPDSDCLVSLLQALNPTAVTRALATAKRRMFTRTAP
jgi:hypothetical protein